MPVWLFWGLLISGTSALYFWKKANPGASLNPTASPAPAGTGSVIRTRDIDFDGGKYRVTVFSDGTARVANPSIDFFITAAKPPHILKVNVGDPALAQRIVDSVG
jgi:hypothetical protein